MAAALLVLFGVVLTIILLYIHQKIRLNYWSRKGVLQDKPHILFGNIEKVLELKHSLNDFVDELYRKYDSQRFVGGYAFAKPVLIIRDRDLIKDITIKSFSSFVNRSFHPDKSFDRMAGRILFGKRDDEWREVRQKIATAFTNTRLQQIFPVLKEIAGELVEKLRGETKSGERTLEILDLNMRYGVDIITAVSFGSRANALQDYPKTSLMYEILGKILSFDFYQGIANNLIFLARPLYVALGRLGLPFHIFSPKIDDHFIKMVDVALQQRLQDKTKHADIFDLIAWTEKPEFRGLENKAAAAAQMLIAGSETSAVTTTFALYELAKQPLLQDRLRKEIVENLNQSNGEITYEAIHRMVYLDQVVKETMRLWPILPFVDRVCGNPYRIPGTSIVIEKGTHVFIPVYSIQRDSRFFPDPEKFDPERFSKENVGSIPEMAYIPFGSGPRYCVGKRLGLLSVKSALVHILKNYEFRRSEQTVARPEFNKNALTLNLKNGMKLLIRPLT